MFEENPAEKTDIQVELGGVVGGMEEVPRSEARTLIGDVKIDSGTN
jgi:hypothetical protein